MTSSIRETEAWRRGDKGQRLVAQLLQEEGYYVVPSYDFSGTDGDKAPKLQGPLKGYIAPDLDCARNGERMWAEVKTKSAATVSYRPSDIPGVTFREARKLGLPGGIPEHGIAERHAEDYLEVERITGTAVHLFIYEETTGDILRAPLAYLMLAARRAIMFKHGILAEGWMVYFHRDLLEVWRNVR